MKPSKNIWIILGVYAGFVIIAAIAIYLFLDDLSDALALGQIFLQILILPTVIIGFFIAIEEFKKAQAIPDLGLYWEIEPDKFEKEVELEIPEDGSTKIGVRPVLVNDGFSVAIWYLLNFDFPLKYLYHEELELKKQNRLQGPVENYIAKNWAAHVGKNENWRIDFIKLEEMRLSFISNGQVASYPGYPQPLGILTITLAQGIEYPQECKIYYSIANDKSQPKHGFLTIKFRRKKKSSKPD